VIDVTQALTDLRAAIPGIRSLKARQAAHDAVARLIPAMVALERIEAAHQAQIDTQAQLIISLTNQLTATRRALTELTRSETT
jgi:hypothetical protein